MTETPPGDTARPGNADGLTADSQQLWDLLERHRHEIEQIGARHGASNFRVFGLAAAGAARSGSDVDFLVDLEPGRSLFDLAGLIGELRGLLGIEVDVVTSKGVRESYNPVARRIPDQAVPL